MKTLLALTVAVPSVLGFLAYVYTQFVAPVIDKAVHIMP